MKELQKLTIDYLGYEHPETDDEVEAQIFGLEVAIKEAEKRIAVLRLGYKIGKMKSKENKK